MGMGFGIMEAYHGKDTYSHKTGSKREPKTMMPALQYHKNQEHITDKEAEFYLLQHKIMHEFISKKGLIEAYNQFQKGKEREAGDLVDWFKKWN